NFGYGIGDRLLKSFGKRLNSSLRSEDIVARWGGDEFAILLPQLKSAENIAKISQRILAILKQPFEIDTHQIYLSSKVGMAIYPQDGEDTKTLLKKAEFALNKHQTLNETFHQFNGFQVNINTKTSQLAKAEHLLYQALQQEEFSLYYQPQVNVKTGTIDGMEALLRWQHPKFGLVSPRQFMPTAEKTDLIVPISKWVLQTACRQNQAWQKSGLPPLSVSVNFSPRQFQQPYLLTMLAQVLADTGLDSRYLELEVTENTILHNLDFTRRALHDLRQIGVNVSIDDFGTGYAALSYLQDLSFHKLKIDRSCVHKLKENPQNTAMIAAVIALGRSFNLKVVAEGVETQQQLELLWSLQCEEMQGYRFSYPLKAKDATHFLSLHGTRPV
ncbi:MAG: putative bifunctional diguanylate cyclase/phosphodiesterase, partial [Microcystaceae cyanobacterium]